MRIVKELPEKVCFDKEDKINYYPRICGEMLTWINIDIWDSGREGVLESIEVSENFMRSLQRLFIGHKDIEKYYLVNDELRNNEIAFNFSVKNRLPDVVKNNDKVNLETFLEALVDLREKVIAIGLDIKKINNKLNIVE